MSEVPDCPYCGAAVRTDRVLDYDNKVKLRCNNCGGIFEFLPGFGSFSLPEQEQRTSVRHEGSLPGYRYDVYEADAPWVTEEPSRPQNGCGTACFVVICLCCILPIVLFVTMIIMGIGLFWF